MRARVGALFALALIGAGLATAPAAAASTRAVPSQYPTIQAAVVAAQPGDTIVVAPGSYNEKVWIKNKQTGLTIEAADPANPPTILGTRNASQDGIRVDSVDGVTFRNLRIVGAYDGVRLNYVGGALLEHLYVENSALGVRMRGGDHNIVRDVVVTVTRVEQGVFVDHSPSATVENVAIANTYANGIDVVSSPGTVVRNVDVDQSHKRGIYVYSSQATTVDGSTATGSATEGFRIANTKDLGFHV